MCTCVCVTHRLHEDVVFAKECGSTESLVERMDMGPRLLGCYGALLGGGGEGEKRRSEREREGGGERGREG